MLSPHWGQSGRTLEKESLGETQTKRMSNIIRADDWALGSGGKVLSHGGVPNPGAAGQAPGGPSALPSRPPASSAIDQGIKNSVFSRPCPPLTDARPSQVH